MAVLVTERLHRHMRTLRSALRRSALPVLASTLLLPLIAFAWSAFGLEATFRTLDSTTRVVVVTRVPEHARIAQAAFDLDNWQVEVVPEAPADLADRLHRGITDIVIVPGPRLLSHADVEFTAGRHASADLEYEAKMRLMGAVYTASAIARAGAAPTVQWAPNHESSLEERDTTDSDVSRPAERWQSTLWCLGAWTGLGIGAWLLFGGSTPFSNLVALQVSAQALYFADLVWILGGCAAALVTAAVGEVAAVHLLPSSLHPSWISPQHGSLVAVGVLVTLTTAIQCLPLGILAVRSAADAIYTLRIPDELVVLFGFGFLILPFEVAPLASTMASVPFHGPAVIWHDAVTTGQVPWTAVSWQAAWTVLAVALGAWIYAIEEGPFALLQRAWRRLLAART